MKNQRTNQRTKKMRNQRRKKMKNQRGKKMRKTIHGWPLEMKSRSEIKKNLPIIWLSETWNHTASDESTNVLLRHAPLLPSQRLVTYKFLLFFNLVKKNSLIVQEIFLRVIKMATTVAKWTTAPKAQ